MKTELKKIENRDILYGYMAEMPFPYNYKADRSVWNRSFLSDTDGEGRTLFSELTTLGAYSGEKLIGFVQYGKSAFGFDESGEISGAVSYPVIRSLYYDKDCSEAGKDLLNAAVSALSEDNAGRIYAFFHYFGMSCYARHGKLYGGFPYIHEMLLQNGFEVEHENVFYSSKLSGESGSEVGLNWHERTSGGQQYCDFILDGIVVGGCEIHFLEQDDIAYLRWIYVNQELCGKGIGSRCMRALKAYLHSNGIARFDTDTALSNRVAQHYYEKNGFVNEGLTRSYYRDI